MTQKQKSYYQYNPISKKLYLITAERVTVAEQESFKTISQTELPILKKTKTSIVFQHSKATLTIEEELGLSNFLSFTLRGVEEPLPTVHNFQIEEIVQCGSWSNAKDSYQATWDNSETVWADSEIIDYGNTVWDPKTKKYKSAWKKPKIFRLFWDYCPLKEPVNFFFDFDLHLIDKDKDEVKPWVWYKWDYVKAEADYIYQTLSPHLPNTWRHEFKTGARTISWIVDHPKSLERAIKEAKLWGISFEEVEKKASPITFGMLEESTRENARLFCEKRNLPPIECGFTPSELQQPWSMQYIDEERTIKVKRSNEMIVAIFGSDGEVVRPWKENDYKVNSYWYHEYGNEWADHKYRLNGKKWDFSTETTDLWIAKYDRLPTLVISFTPTIIGEDYVPYAQTLTNSKKKKGVKLTGTQWVKKLWEVFISKGVPVVLKTYEGFVFQNLFRRLTSENIFGIKGTGKKVVYNSISAITKLPQNISGREMRPTNYLVFFNCPWLEKKEKKNTHNQIPWDPKCDAWNLKMRKNKLVEMLLIDIDIVKNNL